MTVLQRAVQGNKVPGFISGLILANNATDAVNDIDIAAGSAADANGYIMNLASGITKRLDASWAVGTGNGGLDTGSIANGTYHLWLIQRSDTGVVDVLFSSSASSPTMPTNYDRKRRIGSIIRVSAAILGFHQNGDIFSLNNVVADASAVAYPNTSEQTVTLTVPTGIQVRARINAHLGGAGSANIAWGPTWQTLVAANVSSQSGNISTNKTLLEIETNTSGQIKTATSSTTGGPTYSIGTFGWIDTRGRLN